MSVCSECKRPHWDGRVSADHKVCMAKDNWECRTFAELTRLRERLTAETGRADSGERTIQELFKLLAAVEGERDEALRQRNEAELRSAEHYAAIEVVSQDLEAEKLIAASYESEAKALHALHRSACDERDAARKDLETAVGLLRDIDLEVDLKWHLGSDGMDRVATYLAAHPAKPGT